MVVIKEQLEFIVLVYSGWTLPHSNVHYMFFCNKKHWLSYILFNLQIMVLLMKLLQDPLWWQYIDNLMSTLLTFQTSFFFLKIYEEKSLMWYTTVDVPRNLISMLTLYCAGAKNMAQKKCIFMVCNQIFFQGDLVFHVLSIYIKLYTTRLQCIFYHSNVIKYRFL